MKIVPTRWGHLLIGNSTYQFDLIACFIIQVPTRWGHLLIGNLFRALQIENPNCRVPTRWGHLLIGNCLGLNT